MKAFQTCKQADRGKMEGKLQWVWQFTRNNQSRIQNKPAFDEDRSSHLKKVRHAKLMQRLMRLFQLVLKVDDPHLNII